MIQEQRPGPRDAGQDPGDDIVGSARVRPRSEEDHHPPTHLPAAVQSLKQAMRRARFDDAERAGVQGDQRIARLCRLELLQEALQPLLAQVPEHIDLFDIGIMPGANPRLFIDMIGFVEMGRDGRAYGLVQDTRHGRIQLAESSEIGAMVEAVTDYVARRLLERDKALASDMPPDMASPTTKLRNSVDVARQRSQAQQVGRSLGPGSGQGLGQPSGQGSGHDVGYDPRDATADEPTPMVRAPLPRRARLRWLGAAFAFVIDLLGSIAFFTVLAALAWLAWSRLHAQG